MGWPQCVPGGEPKAPPWQIISRPTSEGEAAGQPLRVRALMQLGGAQRMRLLIEAEEQARP